MCVGGEDPVWGVGNPVYCSSDEAWASQESQRFVLLSRLTKEGLDSNPPIQVQSALNPPKSCSHPCPGHLGSDPATSHMFKGRSRRQTRLGQEGTLPVRS